MWLWKKVRNTDIIGKIYILIILFIVIVATITVITRYKNASTNHVVNEEHNEIIEETITSELDVIVDNTIAVAEIKDDNKDVIVEETVGSKAETKKQEKSTINSDNKSTEQTASKEKTKVTVNKEQTSNNETQINKKEEVKQEEQQTEQKEDKQEVEEKEKTTSQEVVRTVKRNNTYIQKMKNYITTNDKSSYSIVVDESIVNNTYGFTYSEFNMSGYIGCYSVYRIYAQDYYVNGEFVETRCYID